VAGREARERGQWCHLSSKEKVAVAGREQGREANGVISLPKKGCCGREGRPGREDNCIVSLQQEDAAVAEREARERGQQHCLFSKKGGNSREGRPGREVNEVVSLPK